MAEALLRGSAKFLTDPCHPKGCLAVQGALASGAEAECIRNELETRRAGSLARIRDRLKRAKKDGDLPPAPTPPGSPVTSPR